MANYVLKGRLCGTLCDDCIEPLSGVKVRLYRMRVGQDATRLAVADAKATFAVLSDDQIGAAARARQRGRRRHLQHAHNHLRWPTGFRE